MLTNFGIAPLELCHGSRQRHGNSRASPGFDRAQPLIQRKSEPRPGLGWANVATETTIPLALNPARLGFALPVASSISRLPACPRWLGCGTSPPVTTRVSPGSPSAAADMAFPAAG